MRLSILELAFLLLAGAFVVAALPRCSGGHGPATRSRPGELAAHPRCAQSRRHASDDRRDDLPPGLDAHDPATGVVHERPEAHRAPCLRAARSARRAFQEDHLISLELGGHPTDPSNLWPEPYPRAADVDRIENELNAKVCGGQLSLAEAQRRESALKHRDG